MATFNFHLFDRSDCKGKVYDFNGEAIENLKDVERVLMTQEFFALLQEDDTKIMIRSNAVKEFYIKESSESVEKSGEKLRRR